MGTADAPDVPQEWKKYALADARFEVM